MNFDLIGWLVDSYLARLDRATMAFSLEGRVPLLDLDVFAIARSLPDAERIVKPRVGKVFLQEYLAHTLGEEYLPSRKHGFGVPIVEIMKSAAMQDRIREHSGNGGSASQRLGEIAVSLAQHGSAAAATRAWYIIVLFEWLADRGMLLRLDDAAEDSIRQIDADQSFLHRS